MKLAYIRWKYAVSEEAADDLDHPTAARLAKLQEVGLLLDENEEAVEIGMEMSDSADVAAGRWSLHNPRFRILERSRHKKRRRSA